MKRAKLPWRKIFGIGYALPKGFPLKGELYSVINSFGDKIWYCKLVSILGNVKGESHSWDKSEAAALHEIDVLEDKLRAEEHRLWVELGLEEAEPPPLTPEESDEYEEDFRQWVEGNPNGQNYCRSQFDTLKYLSKKFRTAP